MRQNSLKTNMIHMGVLVMLFTLILAAGTVIFLRQGIRNDVEEHSFVRTILIKEQIRETVEAPLDLIDATGLLVEEGYDMTSKYITDYMETILKAHNYFEGIHIITLDGEVLNSAPYDSVLIGTSDYYDANLMNAAGSDTYWSKVYVSRYTGGPTISVFINKDDYIIAADINLKNLPIRISGTGFLHDIESLSVVDQWGTYIVSQNYQDVRERRQHPSFADIKGLANRRHDDKEMGYEQLESLGWYIVYVYDIEAVYANVNRMTVVIGLGWLAFSLMLISLVFWNVRQIRSGLDELIVRTRNIIDGDYRLREYYFRFSEFATLAKDFQVMSYEIEKRERHIEEINKNLEKNIEIAEEANNAKSNFLAVMSHEIRTPLNGIIGFLQMLKLSHLKQDERELVNIASNSTQVLRTLINDILDVSKYEMGKAVFENMDFDLVKLLVGATAPYKNLAEEKGLDFTFNMVIKKACWVKSDPTKLTQVVSNLLDNAIKFTNEGYVKFEVTYEIEEDMVHFHAKIKDTGIGIKKEVQAELFQPFVQGGDSISRRFGGSGLGLVICKEIITRMGGTIEVDSVHGIGTTIVIDVTLPVGVSEEEHELITDVSRLFGDRISKVLVVEDNKVNQMLIQRFFSKYGIECDLAVNGKEAVQLYTQYMYKVVFMDCQMPVMNGFEATKMIRSMDNEARIIAMTAYASKEDESKCLSAGMDDYITKPIDLRVVARILGFEEKYLEDLRNGKIDDNDIEELIAGHAKRLEKLIGFDYDTCMELVMTFVQQAREIFDAILKYDSTGEVEEVKKKIHQLKGASGAVRMTEIHDGLMKAEEQIKDDNYTEGMAIVRNIMSMPLFEE